jgi:DNA-binding GntR family transcriptional regulator
MVALKERLEEAISNLINKCPTEFKKGEQTKVLQSIADEFNCSENTVRNAYVNAWNKFQQNKW